MYASVKNGTGAGVKRPYAGKAPDWHCLSCRVTINGYWASCPHCGSKEGKHD